MKARGPGQSPLLLLDVAAVLAKEEVEYAVVGAVAASVHGSIRATTDADVLVSVSPTKLARLQKAFKKARFDTDLRHGDADDPIRALLAVVDKHGNRVDLLAGLRGLDSEAFSRSISVPFLGSSIRVIGREDFIAMKCFAGGPLDLADARDILKAANGSVDVDLLRRLTRRFGRAAADALEQVRAPGAS
jgi:predicted nucleotidyltransferase